MSVGYEEQNGPHTWFKDFPVAKEGKRQSPIDLSSEQATTDVSLRKVPLTWTYVGANVVNIENTGLSWKANVNGKGSCLTGGSLTGEYELWQFHAHWGNDDCRGSEHTVEGKMYPAELHLVYWNRSKYASPNEAASEPDGLSVLGIFLEVGEKKHEELDKVCKMLKKIRFKGEKESFGEPVDPGKFMPEDTKSFWSYEGSLTTPPLLESVLWMVFKQPVQISKEQLETMRAMKTCTKDAGAGGPCMVNNYRPPFPLGNRTLKQT